MTVSVSIAVSSICFGIWGGLWIISLFSFKSQRIKISKLKEFKFLNYILLLYFIAELLSRIFAIYPEIALPGLKRLLLFLIFFASIIEFYSLDLLYKSLLGILIFNSAISVFEISLFIPKFLNEYKDIGVSEVRLDLFNHYLTIGEIKLLLFLSAFPLLFSKEKLLIDKKYWVIILIPILISLIITQSRNVYLALFICLLIFGIFRNRKFLLIYLISLLILFIILPEDFQSRTKSIVDLKHPSNETRIRMWETGFRIFLDYPVLGIGDAKMREIYSEYQTPLTDVEGSHFHSNYIMILVTTGLTGFILFLGIMICLFYYTLVFLKRIKSEQQKLMIWGTLLILIGFNIFGITEWSFGDHEVMTVFLYLISFPFIIKLNSKS